MSIDLSTIRPGGKVSVTLIDGTKIIDSPVNERGHSLFCARNTYRICDVGYDRVTPAPGTTHYGIASIDAYTPPTPEWDRPEVFAVTDRRGLRWFRRRDDEWELQADSIEANHGPCTVLAVYADGVER